MSRQLRFRLESFGIQEQRARMGEPYCCLPAEQRRLSALNRRTERRVAERHRERHRSA